MELLAVLWSYIRYDEASMKDAMSLMYLVSNYWAGCRSRVCGDDDPTVEDASHYRCAGTCSFG